MIQFETVNREDDTGKQERGPVCCVSNTFYGSMRDIGAVAVLAQANELCAKGVKRAAFELKIEVPAGMEKSRVNSIRNHTKWAVELLGENGFEIDTFDVQGGISTALKVPAVTVTAAGKSVDKKLSAGAFLTARAGHDVILIGEVGTEGMLRVIGQREAELRERFTPAFIRQMKAYDTQLCGIGQIEAARECGALAVSQISEGGILAALWNLAKETEKGLLLDMKKFAIRQETIEVCEYFRLNPYQLTSNGSFLVLAEHGEVFVEELKQKGYTASVIGQLTDNNDKVIHNGEDVRYIDRPAPDELLKIFG